MQGGKHCISLFIYLQAQSQEVLCCFCLKYHLVTPSPFCWLYILDLFKGKTIVRMEQFNKVGISSNLWNVLVLHRTCHVCFGLTYFLCLFTLCSPAPDFLWVKRAEGDFSSLPPSFLFIYSHFFYTHSPTLPQSVDASLLSAHCDSFLATLKVLSIVPCDGSIFTFLVKVILYN